MPTLKAILKNFIRPFYRRATLFRFNIKNTGKNVYVNHNVQVTFSHRIQLGNEVHIHHGSSLLAGPDSKIILDNGCRIGPNAVLQAEIGYIQIGRNGYAGPYSIVRGDGGVIIGNDVLISPQVIIMSANHGFANTAIPIRLQEEIRESITIEDDVWIGAGSKILAGVNIGKGSVIGAGAVVTKNIPPYSIAVGIPAQVISHRK